MPVALIQDLGEGLWDESRVARQVYFLLENINNLFCGKSKNNEH